MKKGTVVEGRVERLNFPNKGILTVEGRKMTVKNVLPGQRIAAVVTKGGERRLEGRLQQVLEPAPEERESPCPHFGSCGGCAYQTLPYPAQLQLKENQVRSLLAPVLGIGDPRTDKRIEFVGGIRGLEELVRLVDGGMAAAFAMYPTTLEDLMDIADSGKIMPPKSTWFEPKLRSGLFIHLIP